MAVPVRSPGPCAVSLRPPRRGYAGAGPRRVPVPAEPTGFGPFCPSSPARNLLVSGHSDASSRSTAIARSVLAPHRRRLPTRRSRPAAESHHASIGCARWLFWHCLFLSCTHYPAVPAQAKEGFIGRLLSIGVRGHRRGGYRQFAVGVPSVTIQPILRDGIVVLYR